MLWDNRFYCSECVTSISPALFRLATSGSPLEETVYPEDISALRYVTLMTIPMGLCGAVVALPVGWMCLIGKFDFWPSLIVLACLGGFASISILVQAIVGVTVQRSRLPRKVLIEDGYLRIVSPQDEQSSELQACKWRFGNTDGDTLCLFSGLRNGVLIQTPKTVIACGHSSESLEHWRAFLTLARLTEFPTLGCMRVLVVGLVTIGGGFVGAGLGYVVSTLTGRPSWQFGLAFLGAADGLAIGIILATWNIDGVQSARSRLHPAPAALIFFGLGLNIGKADGWTSALICASANGLLGGLIGWLCHVRLRVESKQNSAEVDHLDRNESRYE